MKQYFLLRHGAYDEGTIVLNKHGVEQTEAAIAYLEDLIESPKVISSQGPRAKQTAEMLSSNFDVKFEIVDWLEKPAEDELFDFQDKHKCIEGIRSKKPLILVTNGEFIHQYIRELSHQRQIKNPLRPLVKGEVMLCSVTDTNIQVTYF